MRSMNLNDEVARSLGIRIVRGEFEPGTTVPPETELAKEYGVSRPVIREGIRQLVSKGLLEARQKRGTVICPTQDWNYFDASVLGWLKEGGQIRNYLIALTEVRLMIEPQAASLAAERASQEQVDGLYQAIEMMVKSEANSAKFLEADVVFHRSLLNASGNRILASILDTMETALRESVSVTNRPGADNGRSTKLHRAVVDQIAKKNSEGAHLAATTLLKDAQEALENALRRN